MVVIRFTFSPGGWVGSNPGWSLFGLRHFRARLEEQNRAWVTLLRRRSRFREPSFPRHQGAEPLSRWAFNLGPDIRSKVGLRQKPAGLEAGSLRINGKSYFDGIHDYRCFECRPDGLKQGSNSQSDHFDPGSHAFPEAGDCSSVVHASWPMSMRGSQAVVSHVFPKSCSTRRMCL